MIPLARFPMPYRLLAAVLFAAVPVSLLAPRLLRAQSVPDGFSVEVVHPRPGTKSLGFAFLPDERILVIGHHSGEVRLLVDGEMKSEPLATIPNLNLKRNSGTGTAAERGLLGIAIDPDWPESSYVYLFYTHASGFNRVSRFRADGAVDDPTSDELEIDLSSEEILLALKDDSEYHNGGTLRFGGDKTLYVSHGEDENWKAEDEAYLQDLTNPYGKILRIERDGTAAADNPAFPEAPGGRLPEVFAIGLRNPFRFAIDPLTGRLFIGDVGTNLREEFNLSDGGENFGYPRHEGSRFFQQNAALIAPEPTPPIFEYAYGVAARAAIALSTYRPKNYPHDDSFPEVFDGVHFYVDYFHSSLRYLRQSEPGEWESETFGSGFQHVTDGAVGPGGSLYLLTYDGPLRKISYGDTNVGGEDGPVALDAELRPNHPNPFRGSTTITYRIGRPDHVRIDVFDVLGRRVATLVDASMPAGVHTVRLGGEALAAGTYVCRLRTGGATTVRTIVSMGR